MRWQNKRRLIKRSAYNRNRMEICHIMSCASLTIILIYSIILHYIVLHCTALPCFILLCLAFRRVCIAVIHRLWSDLYCTEPKRLIIQCNRHITSLSLLLNLIYLSPDDYRTSNNSIILLYYIKRTLSPILLFFLDVCVCVSVSVSVSVFVSFFLC